MQKDRREDTGVERGVALDEGSAAPKAAQATGLETQLTDAELCCAQRGRRKQGLRVRDLHKEVQAFDIFGEDEKDMDFFESVTESTKDS